MGNNIKSYKSACKPITQLSLEINKQFQTLACFSPFHQCISHLFKCQKDNIEITCFFRVEASRRGKCSPGILAGTPDDWVQAFLLKNSYAEVIDGKRRVDEQSGPVNTDTFPLNSHLLSLHRENSWNWSFYERLNGGEVKDKMNKVQ